MHSAGATQEPMGAVNRGIAREAGKRAANPRAGRTVVVAHQVEQMGAGARCIDIGCRESVQGLPQKGVVNVKQIVSRTLDGGEGRVAARKNVRLSRVSVVAEVHPAATRGRRPQRAVDVVVDHEDAVAGGHQERQTAIASDRSWRQTEVEDVACHAGSRRKTLSEASRRFSADVAGADVMGSGRSSRRRGGKLRAIDHDHLSGAAVAIAVSLERRQAPTSELGAVFCYDGDVFGGGGRRLAYFRARVRARAK
jgi:hypothetical protein